MQNLSSRIIQQGTTRNSIKIMEDAHL